MNHTEPTNEELGIQVLPLSTRIPLWIVLFTGSSILTYGTLVVIYNFVLFN